MSTDTIILSLDTPSVSFTGKRGDVITKDQIYERAGFSARNSAGESLMHLVHLGPDGSLDGGITIAGRTMAKIQNFFRYEGYPDFYYMGEAYDITVTIEEEVEPVVAEEPVVAQPEPAGFGAFLVQEEPEQPEEPAVASGRPVLIDESDPDSHRYELYVNLGEEPGKKLVPTLRETFTAPPGKRVKGVALVAYPYTPDGNLIEGIDLTQGGYYQEGDTVEFTPEGGFAQPLPFGYEEGGITVQGVWYAFFVDFEAAPSPWAMATSQPSAQAPDPTPVVTEEEPVANPLKDLWGDSPAVDTNDVRAPQISLDDDDDLPSPVPNLGVATSPPSYQDQVRYEPASASIAFDAQETGSFQQPEVGPPSGYTEVAQAEDDPMDIGDIDLDGEELPQAKPKPKMGFGLKGSKANKPAKEKKPKPPKAPKEPGAKKGKGVIIGAVVAAIAVLGLGGGGFMYRSAGLKAAEPLKAQIAKVDESLDLYLNKEKDYVYTQEDVNELSGLSFQADTHFKDFESSNLFAKMEEKRLYDSTSNKITQIQERLTAQGR